MTGAHAGGMHIMPCDVAMQLAAPPQSLGCEHGYVQYHSCAVALARSAEQILGDPPGPDDAHCPPPGLQ